MALRERDAIRDRRLLVIGLAVLAAVTAAFVLHTVAGLEPAVVALVGGLVLLAASRLDAGEVARDVEWPTLVFFAGLFVMVGALVTHRRDRADLPSRDRHATEGSLLAAALVLLSGSAVLSAIVDNIPYVATISPVVAELVQANGGDQPRHGAVVGAGARRRTWAATPPPSAPRPTSSSSASPNAPATGSPSGSSPGTA